MLLYKIIIESIRQAAQQLTSNKLRSFLSLLGISIGIFCIIGVKTAVDSLEDNIRGSFEQLGSDVIYVSKFSWVEDPGENYMKLMRRPDPSYRDYEAIQRKVKSAKVASFHVFLGEKTAQYKSNSIEGALPIAATDTYQALFDPQVEKGRYFSPTEFSYGANKIVIGPHLAEELFGTIEPVGKTIKMAGAKFEIIGIFEKSGESLIGIMDYEDVVMMPYEMGRKIANLRDDTPFGNATLSVRAAEGVSVETLKDDITGVLRAHRRLKPKEENNFATNEISMLSEVIGAFFGVLNTIAFVIGGFAILVGMFSVANIMFVSVKERTNIIGIKKALGAKRYMILLEFLIEAIILSIIGGLVGLLLVYGIIYGITYAELFAYEVYLSTENVINGVVWSTIIGVLAGIIPAMQASGMDPVVAIRSK
ncbi:MAG: ABC transporter permease [Bacteroidota bacterium]